MSLRAERIFSNMNTFYTMSDIIYAPRLILCAIVSNNFCATKTNQIGASFIIKNFGAHKRSMFLTK